MAEAINENSAAVLATITTNAAGGFLSVSPQFLELIGRPVEALGGVSLSDLAHPSQAAAIRALLATPSADQVTTRLLGSGDRWIPVVLDIGRASEGRINVRLHAAPQNAAIPVEPARVVPAPLVPDLAGRPAGTSAVPSPNSEPPNSEPLGAELSGSEPPNSEPPVPAQPSPEPLGTQLSGAEEANPAPQPQPLTAAVANADLVSGDHAHMAYVASVPADEIGEQRNAVRKSVGDDTTPMLEIDAEGRTVFVQGAWAELSANDAVGADVFEELLANSPSSDEISEGLAAVFETGQPSDFELAVAGLPPRWVRLLPIPSPHLAGTHHALVAVVAESELRSGAATATPVAASPDDSAAGERATQDTPDHGLTTPEGPAGRGPWLAIVAALAAVLVVWGVYSAVSDSQPTASPFTRVVVAEPEPDPEPVSTALEPTEAVQVSDAQTWRSIGAVDLGQVQAVAATPSGGFVADVDGRLIRLDGQAVAVGVSSVSGGSATFISDIAADSLGGVWILDAGLGRVSLADSGGNITAIETETGPLLNARGIAAGLDNTVWVASTAAAQLTQLHVDGTVVSTIALPGRQPSDVALANDGSFWVVDAERLELLHLTESGELITASPLGFFASLESPHLALADDVLWVTEPESSAVFAVDTTTGEANGDRFEITRADGSQVLKPIGIGAAPDGRLWIADSQAGAVMIVGRNEF